MASNSALTTEKSMLSDGQLDEGVSQRTATVRLSGILGGIIMGIIIALIMPDSATPEAKVTAGVVVVMGIWWVTEAVPLAVTAMLPLVLFPAFGVAPMADVAGSYASEIIFLFLGGFLLALGLQRWNLHRRIALLIVLAVGTKPTRMVLGMMIATAVLGMWVSNTATALMMVPLGTSLVTLVQKQAAAEGKVAEDDGSSKGTRFGTGLLVGIAASATLSAFGSIIASPGNIFVVGYLKENFGYEIQFLQWMIFGIPLLVVFLGLAWWIIAHWLWKPEVEELPGGRELFRKELAILGAMSAGEKWMAVIFVLTAASWIFVPIIFEDPWATDAVIAMIGGIATFLIPSSARKGVMVMNWSTALNTPWGMLILFGGGLALSAQVTNSGLAGWVGESLGVLSAVPIWVLIPIIVALVCIFTEFTSSMASIATFVPIIAGLSAELGHDPVVFAILVTQACQCAFMLPVASAPNAIVYGTGELTIQQMVRTGIWLNVIGFVLVSLLAIFGLPLVFGS